ncbi:MAG: tRNA preQ1(34) S-adenosylmethionine ribosyltransferase-isomerase QueA [Fimbriimonadaceae bacterium]|nr:tRNA preQ1(34) S-adenosylmethionine ribosyltransferase-isomerase QueA [Fimbriimonadaceae bacterium]QYK56214.1 MAG: tRNA preQ1(34) S-adenosylmethionine ribosyltransferase-isomerase QueA [Fimbriimonadaceae bacterium]
MRVADFDYHLPEELIAQSPIEPRDASRLLYLPRAGGPAQHLQFRDLSRLLAPGDLLVMNNTRVTALRLFGHRKTGAKLEMLVLGESEDGWEALVKPARKLADGEEVELESGLAARILADLGGGRKRVAFLGATDAHAELAGIGQVPLPPYVRAALANPERYQTVYAASPGSAAAPTAGLHFTPGLLEELAASGVKTAHVTLDVGLDTFRPVAVEEASQHEMHGERCSVPEETAEAVAECRGRVVAVGTTTVRTLESFSTGPRTLETGSRVTRLFITPGFSFRTVDGMLTNFHMPRTTMLFMVAAMASRERLMKAYEEALEIRYRFLSFGDAMMIL